MQVNRRILYTSALSTGGGVAYVGPTDILGLSLSGWWGLRAVNAAYATGSNNAVTIVDSSGLNSTNIVIKANGDLDTATVSTFIGAHGTPSVSQLWDQSGNGIHMTQATVSKMPTLALSVTGGKPAMLFANASFQLLSNASGITLAQPFTVSAVVNKTGTGGVAILDSGVSGVQFGGNGANTWAMFAGAVQPTTTVNDAIFHAAQSLFNGNSLSTLYTSTDNIAASSSRSMLSIGGTGLGGVLAIGGNSANQDWNGYITEVGVWSADQTANQAAMDSNQRAYYGF